MLPVNPPTLQPAPVSGGSGSPSRNFEGEYPIYVPAESVSSYKNAAGWYYYASRIHSIEEMYPTLNYAFCGQEKSWLQLLF